MTESARHSPLIQQYRDAGQKWPATKIQIATWAANNHKWEPQKGKMIAECADEIARAMREEYITDPQGRTVRAKHAARVTRDGKQIMLWDDIRTASREHLVAAFSLRRKQIVGSCHQLKNDVGSYNEN